MGTIPTVPSFAAGDTAGVAAKLNLLRDAINFWALTPRCYAYLDAAQSIGSAAYTLVQLPAEIYDVVQSGDTPSHDNVTNNSRIFFRTAGKYEIVPQVAFATNSTGDRAYQVRLNSAGSSVGGTNLLLGAADGSTGINTILTGSVEIAVSVGDYVELFAYQSSGGALNVQAGQSNTFLRTRLTGS